MPSPVLCDDAKQPRCRLLKTLLLAVLFCCLQTTTAAAVAPTYTVTQNTELNFGTVQIPGGSATDVISTAGAQTGTGITLYGTVSAGDYTVSCTANCPQRGFGGTFITISITPGSACPGLSLGSWQGNWENGITTGALPFTANFAGVSSQDFKLGSIATYTSSVSAGSCIPTFTVTITDSGGNNTNFTENASIGFDVGLALNKNSDIDFGTVSALNASTYRISTAGALSTVSGSGIPLYGTTAASNIQIAGSATDGITIAAGGYTADNGVTPSNAQCSYDGGAAAACAMTGAAPGSGKTLLVGVDVAADGTQAAGTTAAPTFTISVAYQ